jgi:hypothetical protein
VKISPLIFGLAAVVSLFACIQHESAAVIDNASRETKAELEETISRILKKMRVTIADDALTQNDILIISRTPKRNITLNPVLGRSKEKPHRFQLVKIGQACYLKYEATQEKYKLETTSCQALKK